MGLFKDKLSAKDDELATLQSKLDSVEIENESLRKELEDEQGKAQEIATLTEEKEKLTTDLETANSQIEKDNGVIQGLEAELKDAKEAVADFDGKVSEKAQELMVSMGHEAIDETEVENNGDVVAIFKGLKGMEAAEFYKKNRAKILKAMKN